MAEIFIKEAARRIFAVERQSKGDRKGSAWEARAGEGPDHTAEPPRRGNLRKSPWISPGTGLFNRPWGTGGRAGIWTWAKGPVHLLPADPRRVLVPFARSKGTPPAGGTSFLERKEAKNFLRNCVSPAPPTVWIEFHITARKRIYRCGTMRTSSPTKRLGRCNQKPPPKRP